ncbi:penicillin-binding transpeptidase domain-containing protein [Alkalicoccus daliensis]|uniref:serine-type D-Ala-D-Ala carboxypeptidase n=1 Tax=Alkalicoccus daliensis TaxID=745820 RepID=A0A1H0FRV2_9BACI|nr:penicillin-binding transpeptidase domain-containing protein [Alkalicoccus daliensis]SDN97386.1 penicillin-binding protein [Alkalicoccus daliensis]
MKKYIVMLLAAGTIGIAGCSNEEPPHPEEEALEPYLSAWSGQSFEEMRSYLSSSSEADVDSFEWDFAERYESVYSDLDVEITALDFEERNFEEEEDLDLEELTEITYPVQVEMETIAGTLNYSTEVYLEKELVDEEEEIEEWKVAWEPSHFMLGMQDAHDQIAIDSEEPVRGEIFDRNGEPLAINGEVYEAGLVPESTEDLEDSAAQFAEILGLEEETVLELASQYPDNPDWFAPIQNLSLTDDRTEELLEVPGVLLNREEGREYPEGDTAGHLVGHIGAITGEELEENEGYRATSEIGKNGIELLEEDTLRGEIGMRLTVQTEDGDVRDVIQERSAEDGEDVQLTIDTEIQRSLADVLGEDSGAGVVLDPETGETIALVSAPAFDSNLRYLNLADPRAEELETTDVLFERRFQRVYSPGSIWKPFTAIAGLEEGTLDPEETFTIEGEQWQPDDSWGGYEITRVNDSESEIDLTTGMKLSDNIYFAQQALELGADNMEAWGETFGLGEDFPYDFPLYTSQLSNDGLDSEILLADSGYGQGEVEISPVHITALYSIFINEGEMVQPTLFYEDEPAGEMSQIAGTESTATVRDTLLPVTEDSDGSAYREDRGHSRAIAGKTGTAELKTSQTEEDGSQIGWFVSFDHEAEDYITTIMVQNAEDVGGSSRAVDLSDEFWSTLE